MKCVNEEITARESCEFTKEKNDFEDKTFNYTASSLIVKGREIKCVFCGMKHYSDKCETVNDVEARVEINCLEGNHQKKDCRTQVKCYICKGSHNTALCRNKKDIENKFSLVTNTENYVLLQTAVGVIADVKEKKNWKLELFLIHVHSKHISRIKLPNS